MTRTQLIRLCEEKLLKLKHKYTQLLENKSLVYRRGLFFNNSETCEERRRYLKLLPEILYALDRIKNGEFGICQRSGVPIAADQLISTPWMRYSQERGEYSTPV